MHLRLPQRPSFPPKTIVPTVRLPSPPIPVTQTGIGVWFPLRFSPNTWPTSFRQRGFSCSPIPIRTTSLHTVLLFLLGAVTALFVQLQSELTELHVNFMELQPKTVQLQRRWGKSQIMESSICSKKAKSGLKATPFDRCFQEAGYANCGTIS